MYTEELIISLLTVLTPILAKSTMKIASTIADMIPPEVVVYSLSPLYRSSLLLGKRSKALNALVAQKKKEGMSAEISVVLIKF